MLLLPYLYPIHECHFLTFNNLLLDFKCMLSGYDMSPFIRRYAKYLSEKSTAYRLGKTGSLDDVIKKKTPLMKLDRAFGRQVSWYF